MTWHERMRDSAVASNIPSSWRGIVAGYLAGGDPYHAWTRTDWQRFTGQPKLPIFVRSNPIMAEATVDAIEALHSLYQVGAPRGCLTALDLETAVSPAYVTSYGAVLHWAGFLVWTYGSASTVFRNPPLDGRWVADYRGTGPYMLPDPSVRSVQYADPAHGSGGQWDSSTVRWWQQVHAPWWR